MTGVKVGAGLAVKVGAGRQATASALTVLDAVAGAWGVSPPALAQLPYFADMAPTDRVGPSTPSTLLLCYVCKERSSGFVKGPGRTLDCRTWRARRCPRRCGRRTCSSCSTCSRSVPAWHGPSSSRCGSTTCAAPQMNARQQAQGRVQAYGIADARIVSVADVHVSTAISSHART